MAEQTAFVIVEKKKEMNGAAGAKEEILCLRKPGGREFGARDSAKTLCNASLGPVLGSNGGLLRHCNAVTSLSSSN